MSFPLLNKAWELDILPGPKFVLVSLADQANDRGACWPSIPQIASRCGMSERSVSRHLQSLESQNIIRREFVAGRGTKIWLVFATENDSSTPDKLSPPPDTVSSLPLTNCHHPLTPCHPTPDTVSSKPSITINNHQERERSRNAPYANQTQVPDDFVPDQSSTASVASAKTAGVDVEHERQMFVLHYQANGEYRSNWQAQFRKWLLQAQQRKADEAKRSNVAQMQGNRRSYEDFRREKVALFGRLDGEAAAKAAFEWQEKQYARAG